MLRSIKQLYGDKLNASDGQIGHVKDFYFDDQNWVIRYVVADTGSWLAERLVLISPHAFGVFQQDGDSLFVNLTRQQIENSPSIDSHEPVSRQYEEEYYTYYRWPSYWAGGGMWGMSGFPMALAVNPMPLEQTNQRHRSHSDEDPHLRGAKALNGYHIQTTDGEIGHVIDFIMDDTSWAICQLAVETGHWYAGKEIVIPPQHVDRISYEDSKVFVNVTKESIQDAAEYHTPPAVYHNARNFD